MLTRTALALALLGLAFGCASGGVWLAGAPVTLDDYPAARVRVYRSGQGCRLEVTTATETLVTLPTRCVTITHRVRP